MKPAPGQKGILTDKDGHTYITSGGQTRENPDDVFVAADREAGRTDYLKNQSWRLGTVPLRDFADHAPINYARAFF